MSRATAAMLAGISVSSGSMVRFAKVTYHGSREGAVHGNFAQLRINKQIYIYIHWYFIDFASFPSAAEITKSQHIHVCWVGGPVLCKVSCSSLWMIPMLYLRPWMCHTKQTWLNLGQCTEHFVQSTFSFVVGPESIRESHSGLWLWDSVLPVL